MQEALLYLFHDMLFLCFADNHDAAAQLEHRGGKLWNSLMRSEHPTQLPNSDFF